MYLYEENTAVASHLEVADRLKIFLTQTLGWSAITDAVIGGIHRWVFYSSGTHGFDDIYIQIEHDPATPNRLTASGWLHYDPVTDIGTWQLIDTTDALNQTVIADGMTPTEVNFYGDEEMFLIVVEDGAGLTTGNYFGLLSTITRRQRVATLTQEALVPDPAGVVEVFVDRTDFFEILSPTVTSWYQLRANQGLFSIQPTAVDPGVSVTAVLRRGPYNFTAWPVGTKISSDPIPLYVGDDWMGIGRGRMMGLLSGLGTDNFNAKMVSETNYNVLVTNKALSMKGQPYLSPVYKRLFSGGSNVETRGVPKHVWAIMPSTEAPFDSGDTFEDQDGRTYRLYRVWSPVSGFEIGGVAVEL